MGKVMNWGGGVINWIAYIWLIASESVEEITCCTRGILSKDLYSVRSRGQWEPSRLQAERHSNNEQVLLVPHGRGKSPVISSLRVSNTL
jgi:hypothetical protein